MKRSLFCLLPLALVVVAAAARAQQEKWLHVRVDSKEADGETVRVNVPLSFAEKVLPTIQADKLRDGKVRINGGDINGVDLRALMDAIRSASDSEFVTVDSKREHVRVAKQGATMLIKVREEGKSGEQVDIQVPMSVVEALLSSGKNELDIGAAIRALRAHGDTELVKVTDETETVHIWVDAENNSSK